MIRREWSPNSGRVNGRPFSQSSAEGGSTVGTLRTVENQSSKPASAGEDCRGPAKSPRRHLPKWPVR